MQLKVYLRALGSLAVAPALWILYVFSFLIPRRANLWVFGSYKNLFCDNSKYLFLETSIQDKSIEAIWISGSRDTVQRIRKLGFAAYARWSLRGMWYAARSGVHVYSSYLSDTNYWLSGTARRVNLWHGVPLKKIGRDISQGALNKRHYGSFLYRLPFLMLRPFFYSIPTVLLAPSKYLGNILVRAMGASPASLMPAMYPRLQALGIGVNAGDRYTEFLDTQVRQSCAQHLSTSGNIHILYAPTWRTGVPNLLEAIPLDWTSMNMRLTEMDAVLYIKLHANSFPSQSFFSSFNRIILMSEMEDVYPLLGQFHCLITDYSSIYYDFLWLDRELIFFPYDLEDYLSHGRPLYTNYEQATPGAKARTGSELINLLGSLGDLDYASHRRAVRETVWADCQTNARIALKHHLRRT